MKTCLLCIIGFVLFAGNLSAQTLLGTIVNKKGEPVPNSTIYIHELARGIAADDSGQFRMTLHEGAYTFEFRSLGYETLTKPITIGRSGASVRIELEEKTYLLEEVLVHPDRNAEDPAYRIMRKAIAYAPHYRYQVKEYTSEAYIKGTFTIDKIPALLKRSVKVNNENVDINTLIGKPMIVESENQVRFLSPDTYHQKVVALKTSVPKEFNMNKGLNTLTSSIYNEQFGGQISPLSMNAFTYYTFRLEDTGVVGDQTLYIIHVIPKKKSADLLSGYIHILSNTWNVYIADLISKELGITMHYRINYHEVKPSVFLPTTYDLSMKMNTMGIKASGRYYASIQYNSVALNSSAAISQRQVSKIAGKAASPNRPQRIKQLEEFAQKEKITDKEARKMAKLMTDVSEPEKVKNERRSLEIKEIERVKMEVDSLAWMHDSTYWAQVRKLPLHDDERISYRLQDSLGGGGPHAAGSESDNVVISVGESRKGLPAKLLAGDTWKLGKNASLGYSGLARAVKEYNFVDGFWLGQALTFRYETDGGKALSVAPSVYYTTARQKAVWQVAAAVDYAPMSLGHLSLSAGHISNDVKRACGVSRWMNSLAALGLGSNYIRFYDSRFLRIENGIDLVNGLRLLAGFLWEERQPLANRTSFNLLQTPVPDNVAYAPHTAAVWRAGVTYTPFYRYRIRDGKKEYDSSLYPTFSLLYEKGTGLFNSMRSPNYDRMSFSVTQQINRTVFDRLQYTLAGGGYLNSNRLYPYDYKYFTVHPMLFTDTSFENGFNLLPPYTAAKEWWAEGHITYQSDYLLIKNLPFLQEYLLDEAVHINGLATDNGQFYFEGGYSVGWMGMGRIGVFAGFEGRQFDRLGVRISIPLLNMFEKH
ncbi:DUF5686 family protein [Limibacterium fermenti]|uniref:DUF5686 family protein n=1 Tax=Limibacterium fermenti TaxID=3229863 RepID=UPI003A67A22E